MKRSSTEPHCSMEPPSFKKRGRSNSNEIELRVLVASRAAGAIIGRNGSRITRLRAENQIAIRIPDSPGPERVLSIKAEADDEDKLFDVWDQILPDLNDNYTNGTVEVRLIFHWSQIGGVIGPGGRIIKQLRETSGANIKVYDFNCPQSTDRIVTICGDIDIVSVTVKDIFRLANEDGISGRVEPYDPCNYDVMDSNQYGGFSDSSYRIRRRSGQTNEDYMERDSSSFDIGSPVDRRSRDKYDRGGGETEESTTSEVSIPVEFSGVIIGRQGSRIRRVREESGATIVIAETLPGASDRTITISGSSKQIQKATHLLQQSVLSSPKYSAYIA